MKGFYHSFVFMLVLILPQIYAFRECRGDENLNLELEKAASKASIWLSKYLVREPARNDSHIDAIAYHSLRLAGYSPTGNLSQHEPSLKNAGRLALYVNGFIATCQDPDQKFLQRLKHCTAKRRVTGCGLTHPFQYFTAVLALCNSEYSFNPERVLINIKHMLYYGANTGIDTFALASLSLSCIIKRIDHAEDQFYNMSAMVRERNLRAVQWLMAKQDALDGSFGDNGVSTALAAQALLAYQVPSQSWQCPKTMKYLLSQQQNDGSFGGVMSTIQILTILKGATPLDHERIKQGCNKTKQHNITEMNKTGNNVVTYEILKSPENKQNITVTMVIESDKFECHYDVKVKNDSNAHDILLAAMNQYTDPQYTYPGDCRTFTFQASYTRYGPYIQSMLRYGEVKNKRLHWMMYTSKETMATVGVGSYRPKNGTSLIFKLEKVGI